MAQNKLNTKIILNADGLVLIELFLNLLGFINLMFFRLMHFCSYSKSKIVGRAQTTCELYFEVSRL